MSHRHSNPYRGVYQWGWYWIREGVGGQYIKTASTMENETKINQFTPEEFLDCWLTTGRYNHLKIILSKNNNRTLGQHYLVVSAAGYGVYQLNDIDYNNGTIVMTLTNTDTVESTQIRLDINNEHPQYFLICWDDIVNMVKKEDAGKTPDNNLLDFDFTCS